MRKVPVSGVLVEESRLVRSGVNHRFLVDNILLAAVDDTNEAQLQWINSASKDVESVGASIHKIELGEDTNCSLALGINRASELERLGISEINVCGGDRKDNTN